jgi:uncharacterized membrane protein
MNKYDLISIIFYVLIFKSILASIVFWYLSLRVIGLVVWFFVRVKEVPSSILGLPHFLINYFIFILFLIFYLLKTSNIFSFLSLRAIGLVVWFFVRVKEVPSSILGLPRFFFSFYLNLIIFFFLYFSPIYITISLVERYLFIFFYFIFNLENSLNLFIYFTIFRNFSLFSNYF